MGVIIRTAGLNKTKNDLDKDIIGYEPKLALNGGIDGFSAIKKVIVKSSILLKRFSYQKKVAVYEKIILITQKDKLEFWKNKQSFYNDFNRHSIIHVKKKLSNEIFLVGLNIKIDLIWKVTNYNLGCLIFHFVSS